jgi:hypothetical protein
MQKNKPKHRFALQIRDYTGFNSRVKLIEVGFQLSEVRHNHPIAPLTSDLHPPHKLPIESG